MIHVFNRLDPMRMCYATILPSLEPHAYVRPAAIGIQSSRSYADVKALPDGMLWVILKHSYMYAAAVAELKISANKQAQLKNKIKSPHRSKLFNIQEIALNVLLKHEIKPPSCSIS